jgi:ankyrin repeat protein
VAEALVKATAAVNQGKANGATPLFIAAHNDHIAAVKALVKAGAAFDQARPTAV